MGSQIEHFTRYYRRSCLVHDDPNFSEAIITLMILRMYNNEINYSKNNMTHVDLDIFNANVFRRILSSLTRSGERLRLDPV